MQQKIVIGNWKMHGQQADCTVVRAIHAAYPAPICDIVVCPPATLLAAFATECAETSVQLGAQDCHSQTTGAFTGDLSASMLYAVGARFVIVGHSERRIVYGLNNTDVQARAQAALAAGITPVVCIGETSQQRSNGETLSVLEQQITESIPHTLEWQRVILAYEPIWAIGTGRAATPDDIAGTHAHIHQCIQAHFGTAAAVDMRLLYGGSVNATNARAIFGVPHVDGALVGGASLRAKDFNPIIAALAAAP